MPELDDYTHLWDGSQRGWEVHWTNYQVWTFALVFRGEPTVEEIRAARELLPHLRDLGARDAFRLLRGSKKIDVPGPLSGIEASHLAQRAAELGLEVEMGAIDKSSGVPVRSGVALLIEDDDIAREVCQRMIAAGVRVAHAEAD